VWECEIEVATGKEEELAGEMGQAWECDDD
jgi:hypothetical protein